MFPIRWNKAFRKKDGSISTIGAEIDAGGGGGYELPTASAEVKGGVKIGSGLTMTNQVLSADAQLPASTVADAGKVLTVGDDGSLEWDEAGGSGGDGVYVGENDPTDALGENGDFYLKVKKVKEILPLIPAVSDATNVICSEEWTSGGEGWHLFDGSLSTYWSTREGYNTNEYCGYDFGDNGAVIATIAGICPRRWGSSNQIEDFKIQASNDNETWVDLYTGSIPNEADKAGVMNYFEFENSTAYRYYRLFVVNANSSQTITVFEFQLYNEGSEYIGVEVEEEFKKVNGFWIREVNGYKFQTHSTGGSDASIDVYINKYGVYELYGTILYTSSGFEDNNVSLVYNGSWYLTPKRTLYDAQGNVVTQETWAYSVNKLIEWFIDDPT